MMKEFMRRVGISIVLITIIFGTFGLCWWLMGPLGLFVFFGIVTVLRHLDKTDEEKAKPYMSTSDWMAEMDAKQDQYREGLKNDQRR